MEYAYYALHTMRSKKDARLAERPLKAANREYLIESIWKSQQKWQESGKSRRKLILIYLKVEGIVQEQINQRRRSHQEAYPEKFEERGLKRGFAV